MLNKKLSNVRASATAELIGKIAELKRQGVDVICFNVGEPDFDTPENIKIAAKIAIDNGFTKYTAVQGCPEIREAISQKLKTENNINYTTEEVVVTTGAKQAIFNALFVMCNPGDEVIIVTPCWVSYIDMVKLVGATPVLVKSKEEDKFQLNVKDIEKALTKNTKAVILNTPNNPAGAVYSEKSLREIGELAVKHNFYIISDEIYEKLIYENQRHISIAVFSPEIKRKTITINGFSKAYAMTGWRLGYAAGPEEIIKAMVLVQGHMTSSANSISQKAGVSALLGPQDKVNAMIKIFDKRRKYIIERLRNIERVKCVIPKGGFYVFPNVSSYFGKEYKGRVIKDSIDFSKFILEEVNVAVVPGKAFEGPENIRIAYSNSLKNIEKGMNRIEKILIETN